MSKKSKPGAEKESEKGSAIKVALIGLAGALVGAFVTYQVGADRAKTDYAIKLQEEQTKRKEIEAKYGEERLKAQELRQANAELQKQLEATIRRYTQAVDLIVSDIVGEENRREGPSQWVRIARQLVRVRNDFRKGLDEVREQLNSEIDQLAALTGEGEIDPVRTDTVKRLLLEFKDGWPRKKSTIEIGLRRVTTGKS